MNSKIKNFLLLLLCIFETVFVFSVTKKEPIWLHDYLSIYPSSEYIVQMGTGETEDKAKASCVAEIGKYFNTQVKSNLTAKELIVNTNDDKFKQYTIDNEIEVKTDVELFAIEFEETYYSKKEKKYYSLGHIHRDTAWEMYKSQIEMSKSTFYSFYNKAEESDEHFFKFIAYKQAQLYANDFLEKLKFGSLLHPKKSTIYNKDRDIVSNLPVLVKDNGKKSSLAVSVKGDYNNILGNSVKQLFINEGFEFNKNSSYTLSVEINPNVEGNEPLTIYPSVYVELRNSKGDIFFTYDYTYPEKTIAYALETAQRKVYPKIAEILSTEMYERLKDVLNF